MARIFLCHASEDKPQVREVYHRLKALGFEPWLDEEDLLPGQNWTREIPRALQTSDFILIFFSRTSVAKRGYVQREMKLALDALQEIPEETIYAIPVRLDDCEVPASFQHYHYANLFAPNGFDRIVRAIHAEIARRPTTQSTAVESFSIGMEFVLIPAGTFLMGTADGGEWERPEYPVRISQPFYLGRYPVTQDQWVTVMGNNPSQFQGGANRPVETVSWEDVHVFIQTLNARERGEDYRLPREAEWEYACRAGSTASYGFGDDPNQLGEYAWYSENAGGQPHPVGLLKPNAWGLYDMHGNVWEWVQDWYGPYPTDSLSTSPGLNRVNRGGSWVFDARFCRSATRGHLTPDHRAYDTGFRLLRAVL